MLEDFPEAGSYHPKYFDLLSGDDQIRYTQLRATFSSQLCRNRRGRRLEGFSEMVTSIQAFCIRHDEDDWKRCLVCGVCWLPAGMAINNRQLSILIDKCKSSINGSLQKMGYTTLQSRTESSGPLCDAMPVLKDNFNELREWTVRLFVAATPQPKMPQYSVDTAVFYQSPAPRSCPAFPTRAQIDLAPDRHMEPIGIPQTQSAWAEPFFDTFCLEPTGLQNEPTPAREAPKFDDIFDPLFPVDPFASTDKWP
jgi:hypothetical protein